MAKNVGDLMEELEQAARVQQIRLQAAEEIGLQIAQAASAAYLKALAEAMAARFRTTEEADAYLDTITIEGGRLLGLLGLELRKEATRA